ncbi:hypothetical protein Scep_000100 [Stephania cephalantha]|uniref:Phosphatidylinositol N-acetylglucosaminyltransferase subunit H conserved domain-containing protein n=1 Tax=Stephania cephalantha TaxID=152367 RepID=A0AAP0L9M5_9MAGN
MVCAPVVFGKYVYLRGDDDKGPHQAVDSHQILVRKKGKRSYLLYLIMLPILANMAYVFLAKEKVGAAFIGTILLSLLFMKVFHGKSIKKESVVIMPGFGVQLETHYSRRVVRRFVPIGKILRPVLNECVTPVTCYWSLALIIHGEDELMLVFQELGPPVKMLVPIWKALCAATDAIEKVNTTVADT